MACKVQIPPQYFLIIRVKCFRALDSPDRPKCQRRIPWPYPDGGPHSCRISCPASHPPAQRCVDGYRLLRISSPTVILQPSEAAFFEQASQTAPHVFAILRRDLPVAHPFEAKMAQVVLHMVHQRPGGMVRSLLLAI